MLSNGDLTNVVVLEILEQRDLADCSAWSSFLVFEANFLEGHQVVRQPRLALKDSGVGALKKQKTKTKLN